MTKCVNIFTFLKFHPFVKFGNGKKFHDLTDLLTFIHYCTEFHSFLHTIKKILLVSKLSNAGAHIYLQHGANKCVCAERVAAYMEIVKKKRKANLDANVKLDGQGNIVVYTPYKM